MTDIATHRKGQRDCLIAFLRAFDRETPLSLLDDPSLLWQQLFNRLQWATRDCSVLADLLGPALEARTRPNAPGWLRLTHRPPESVRLLRTLRKRTPTIQRRCVFSSDGRVLVSDDDTSCTVWDVQTGRVVLEITGLMDGGRVRDRIPGADEIEIVAGPAGAVTMTSRRSGHVLATLRDDADFRDVAIRTGPGRTGSTRRWSPLGDLVAVDVGERLEIVATQSGERLTTIRPESGQFVSCVFGIHGRHIAPITGGDARLHVLDMSTGRELAAMMPRWAATWGFAGVGVDGSVEHIILPDTEFPVAYCGFSPDGSRIASLHEQHADPALRLWDAVTYDPVATLAGRPGLPHLCRFSRDGRLIVTVSDTVFVGEDEPPILWSASDGTALATLAGHDGAVLDCAFSPDGAFLATCGTDGVLNLWETGGALREAPRQSHRGPVYCCSCAPDESRVASGGLDNMLRLWPTTEPGEPACLEGHRDTIYDCAFSPDGRTVASAGKDGVVKLWDTGTGRSFATLGQGDGLSAPVLSCAFAPTGDRLVTHDGDEQLTIWDALFGGELGKVAADIERVSDFCFSPDGNNLLVAGNGGALGIWDTTACRAVVRFVGHDGQVTACAFSPDGQLIASVADDGTLRTWRAATGEVLAVAELGPATATWCGFTPDGQEIVTIGAGVIDHWSAPALEPGGHTAVGSFDPDLCATSRSLATMTTACGPGLVLLDCRSGNAVASFPVRRAIRAVACSPNGGLVCFGDDAGNVYVLEPMGRARGEGASLGVRRWSRTVDEGDRP
jgi:WD40 repeat protein